MKEKKKDNKKFLQISTEHATQKPAHEFLKCQNIVLTTSYIVKTMNQ